MRVKEALRSFGNDYRDAELLLLHCLGRDERSWLIAHGRDELSTDVIEAYSSMSAERLRGVPLPYLLGRREFWSLKLKITRDVLIPRPETELLVEWALDLASRYDLESLVDLGTGSGAIALAVQHELPHLSVTASDVSESALDVARENAEDLGLPVEFVKSSWFDALEHRRWALIASNPPYVAADDLHLQEGDLRFEPNTALIGGTDGLSSIREIASGAPNHLEEGGWLLIEHGYDQAADVRSIFELNGFSKVSLRHDLAGRPRVTGGCWQC
ncbi:MAG: peptide chain release factor N(5)-glutamine methyltransferase [Pseudomonadota bacterium]|nr:peptide chain release factor N(5)-glutamine methyltransferase [Pseudomonadota bacterium]